MQIDVKNPRQVRSLNALLDHLYDSRAIMHHYEIEEVGYNEHTGYVYVYYDGISLALFEGRTEGIHVFVFDEETGDEIAYDSIEDYYKQTAQG